MPVKFTKAIEAVKKTTVLSTYVTALPVAPASGHLAAYVDLAAADQHRDLEVVARLAELINRAREEDYRRPSSTTCYYYTTLVNGKSRITFTLTSTDIVEGAVAIGIEGTVRGGTKGSMIMDSCWNEMIAWANEQYRLTV